MIAILSVTGLKRNQLFIGYVSKYNFIHQTIGFLGSNLSQCLLISTTGRQGNNWFTFCVVSLLLTMNKQVWKEIGTNSFVEITLDDLLEYDPNGKFFFHFIYFSLYMKKLRAAVGSKKSLKI